MLRRAEVAGSAIVSCCTSSRQCGFAGHCPAQVVACRLQWCILRPAHVCACMAKGRCVPELAFCRILLKASGSGISPFSTLHLTRHLLSPRALAFVAVLYPPKHACCARAHHLAVSVLTKVRASVQALVELEIPHIYHTVARNSPKREEMTKKWNQFQVPYLEDPNTGLAMFESNIIVDYLNDTYAVA